MYVYTYIAVLLKNQCLYVHDLYPNLFFRASCLPQSRSQGSDQAPQHHVAYAVPRSHSSGSPFELLNHWLPCLLMVEVWFGLSRMGRSFGVLGSGSGASTLVAGTSLFQRVSIGACKHALGEMVLVRAGSVS